MDASTGATEMIGYLIAAWLSVAYLSLSLYLHKREIRANRKTIEGLVKENNRLHRERKQKNVQIKRLCHGNPELN